MLKKRRSSLNNEKGMAVIEMVPILIVIVMFVNFSIGFFGAIHTGILNSIASRNYAFETFRNRSNLIYMRNTGTVDPQLHFSRDMFRVHGVISESEASKNSSSPAWRAPTRLIDFMSFSNRAAEVTGNNKGEHNKALSLQEGRNQNLSVNPIWIKTVYGICLNATCGS